MKIAVWHNQHGPAMAFSIPDGKAPAADAGIQHAAIKGRGWPRPFRDLEAKGSDPTWEEWAEHLTRQTPREGWWSVEEVPGDVVGLRKALELVAARARQEHLGGGPVEQA